MIETYLKSLLVVAVIVSLWTLTVKAYRAYAGLPSGCGEASGCARHCGLFRNLHCDHDRESGYIERVEEDRNLKGTSDAIERT